MITNELQARYHSHSSIGGPFKLPVVVQKQQATTSVHKTHHISLIFVAITYALVLSGGQSYPTRVKIHGKPCTNNVLDTIITAGIDGYQIMCNLCRYGPSPDWSQLHPGPARSGPGHEILHPFLHYFLHTTCLYKVVKTIIGDLQLLLKYWEYFKGTCFTKLHCNVYLSHARHPGLPLK